MKQFVALGEAMLELSSAGEDLWKMGVAGDTLNTLWYARSALSADWQTSFATMVGRDSVSQKMRDFLAENAIGTERILLHPKRVIGLYAIRLEAGERHFTYWREHSAARCLADEPERLERLLQGADTLYFSGISLAILPPEGRENLLQAVAKTSAQGGRIAFDPNYRPALWETLEAARKNIKAAARMADFLLPGFEDEAACFGDADPTATLERYREWGAKTIIVKNSGGPIHYFHAEQRGDSGALPWHQPIDSTAAGDSFNGAFLAAILEGSTLTEAINRAHQLATKVIRHKGALIPLDRLA